MKKGLPAVQDFGAAPEPVEISLGVEEAEVHVETTRLEDIKDDSEVKPDAPPLKNPPKDNDFLWQWKVCGLHCTPVWY